VRFRQPPTPSGPAVREKGLKVAPGGRPLYKDGSDDAVKEGVVASFAHPWGPSGPMARPLSAELGARQRRSTGVRGYSSVNARSHRCPLRHVNTSGLTMDLVEAKVDI